jgi:hypothetical protein
MPYESQAQSRFIHAKAGEGVPWAKKFVADAQHGAGSVKSLPARASSKRSFKGRRKRG